MQNLQDIQDKILFETTNILQNLSPIETAEDLLSKQDLFLQITDRIAFLKILETNKDSFLRDEIAQNVDENASISNLHVDELMATDDLIEEEVQFTNEINNVRQEELEEEMPIVEMIKADEAQRFEVSENVPLENFIEDNQPEEKEIPFVVEQEEPNYEERVLQKEKELLESEERRRTIIEFSKEDWPNSVVTEPFEEENQDHQLTERKFKLANIKGLKAVQNLFDEDPLEDFEAEQLESAEKANDSGSLLKTNISTDFMEAEKKKPEFKLDLNDKMAFTKFLFKGNDEQLKSTIEKLNSFNNLEEAKQFLSEIYYEKDWQKSDEYAQRLWSLVENKFL